MIRRDALLQTYVREKALRSIISSAHGKSSRLFNSTESHAILPGETVFQQPVRARSAFVDSIVYRRALISFAWSHFLRKTGSPLFWKMLYTCWPSLIGISRNVLGANSSSSLT